MAKRHLVLLPGLDGTGSLFAPLLAVLPENLIPVVVTYPPDKILYYEQLFPYIREVMPWNERYLLLAESFAGPLALKFAADQRESIEALILCSASFSKLDAPPGSWTSFFTKEKWFQCATPDSAFKQLVTGGVCEPALLKRIKVAIKSVNPEVLSHRVRLMFETDVTAAVKELRAPVLCVAGSRDKLGTADAMQSLLAGKPNVRSITLDTSHLVVQTKPQEVVNAIQHFVQTLPAS